MDLHRDLTAQVEGAFLRPPFGKRPRHCSATTTPCSPRKLTTWRIVSAHFCVRVDSCPIQAYNDMAMEHGSLASKFLPSRKAREAPLLVWRTSRAYRPIHYRPCAHPLPNRSPLSASPHSSRPSKESATLSPPDRERACSRSPFPSCPQAIYALLRYMRKPEETTRRERGSVEAGKKPPFVHDQPSAGWARWISVPGGLATRRQQDAPTSYVG